MAAPVAAALPQAEAAQGRAPRTLMQQLVGTKLRVTVRVCVCMCVCAHVCTRVPACVCVCATFNEITNYSKTHTTRMNEFEWNVKLFSDCQLFFLAISFLLFSFEAAISCVCIRIRIRIRIRTRIRI